MASTFEGETSENCKKQYHNSIVRTADYTNEDGRESLYYLKKEEEVIKYNIHNCWTMQHFNILFLNVTLHTIGTPVLRKCCQRSVERNYHYASKLSLLFSSTNRQILSIYARIVKPNVATDYWVKSRQSADHLFLEALKNYNFYYKILYISMKLKM